MTFEVTEVTNYRLSRVAKYQSWWKEDQKDDTYPKEIPREDTGGLQDDSSLADQTKSSACPLLCFWQRLTALRHQQQHPLQPLSPSPATCSLETSRDRNGVFVFDSLAWNFPSQIYPVTFWSHLQFRIHNILWKDIPQLNSFVWTTFVHLFWAARFLLEKTQASR